ncbi:tRNA pseudouridine(13) synthase TruD, partial [Candidatus Hodarchaeum mangrovi]
MTIFSNDLKDFNASLSVGILYFSVPFFKGTGGKIKQTEEDFIVYEILPNGIPIKDGSELGPSLGGMYTHCVLVKSGIDTFTAIKRISQALKIPEKDIGYAGLKDAKAKTYQRISLWGTNFSQFSSLSISNLQLINPIRQKFGVKIGDLSGNLFDIQIKDINRNPSKFEWNFLIKTLNTSGLLNYFGKQRFGSVR